LPCQQNHPANDVCLFLKLQKKLIFPLTENQPEYISYLKDIEYLNLKLTGHLKKAVLASSEETGSNEAINSKPLRRENPGGSSPQ
jgi:hypothetical protein